MVIQPEKLPLDVRASHLGRQDANTNQLSNLNSPSLQNLLHLLLIQLIRTKGVESAAKEFSEKSEYLLNCYRVGYAQAYRARHLHNNNNSSVPAFFRG